MSKNKEINVIIIDDSAQARKLLRLMLLELAPNVCVLGEAESADEGLKMVQEHNPDALFLDIEMPGKSGLQLAELLIENKFKGNVVFTTAYNEYAIKAFRLSAIDYLLKPIQESQLIEAVEKLSTEKRIRDNEIRLLALSANLREEKTDVLCIPMLHGFEYIPISEVEYLEADGSYVNIYCINNRKKTVSKNLKFFEVALEKCVSFVRTHRSFFVNMNFVTNYSKTDAAHHLILKRNVKIPVSRERKKAVQDLMR